MTEAPQHTNRFRIAASWILDAIPMFCVGLLIMAVLGELHFGPSAPTSGGESNLVGMSLAEPSFLLLLGLCVAYPLIMKFGVATSFGRVILGLDKGVVDVALGLLVFAILSGGAVLTAAQSEEFQLKDAPQAEAFRLQAPKSADGGAVDAFHRRYTASDFSAIYETSHSALKEGMTKEEVRLRLVEVHTKLGNGRDVSSSCETVVIGSNGRLLRVEYLSKFEKGTAWETYDWRIQGKDAKLLAYAVETGFEDGKPDWEVWIGPKGIRANETSCSKDDSMWWETVGWQAALGWSS